MKITYIDHMGTDLTVVNAARVSFNKQSDWEWDCPYCTDQAEECWTHDDVCGMGDNPIQGKKVLSQRDEKLIAYLATHGHWTPFSHPQLQVHVKAPIFVARQLDKHQVGLTRNEISRRYVDYEPEFYQPMEWRERADNKKQGSGDSFDQGMNEHIQEAYGNYLHTFETFYSEFLRVGVCPEQARMILPQSMYTEWYWTGSLYAFARVFNLRCTTDAQKETRELVLQLDPILRKYWPISTRYLIGDNR